MINKIHIAFIVPDLKGFGGIQTLAKETASLFTKTDSTYIVKQYGWYYKEVPLLIRAFLRYSPGAISNTFYDLIVKKHFKNEPTIEADIYHYWHADASLPYLNKPYIITAHGKELLKKNLTGFRYNKYNIAFTSAAAIHANSQYTKNLILLNFSSIDPNKIIIINPGTPNYTVKNRSQSRKKKHIIGTLTRLVGRKNVKNVIKSLVILRDVYKIDFIYYLAGAGPEQKRLLSELERSGIEYRYFGAISEKDKVDIFYPSLDIFVLPPIETSSDVEGFGIVYLEANMFGVPVVAANTGGISDAVKSGISGLFADPGNPADIAKVMNKVLISEKDWKISTTSWANQFSQKIIANQFEDMYKNVLQAQMHKNNKHLR